MADTSDQHLRALQRGIREKLGHCLLALQAYEGLIKAIVAQHEVSGTGQTNDLAAREKKTRRDSLGTLVEQLLRTFLTADGESRDPVAETDRPGGGTSFHVRMWIGFPAGDYLRLKADLRDFVSLRNDLVHHFLARHDLASPAGCRIADQALVAAARRIERHHEDLRTWAGDLERCSSAMAEFMRSGAFHEFMEAAARESVAAPCGGAAAPVTCLDLGNPRERRGNGAAGED